MSAKRLAATIAALGISVASLAACSSGPETGPSQSDDTGTTGDNQVFTVVQYEDPKSALVQGWQLAAEIFEDQHPGVTVDLQTTSFDSMQKNAKLLLSGNDVPDVVEVNLGNADAGQLASQGLIDPLTDEVTARGWDQKVTGAMQSLARYDERGLAGEGDWYGVPNIGQYVTVYYNKDMFEKAGIDSIPTNLDEFESMLGTLSATGVTPIASSASADQGFNQLWWWYSLVSARLDRQGADDYVLLDAPVNFNSQPWEDGTRQFQDWIDAGYFGNELGGLSFEQALVNFLSGNAAMYMWNFTAYNRIMDNPDFEAGFFTLPGSEMVLGNSGHLWSIPSASKNKDLAYDWIDITMSSEVQNKIANLAGLALAADPDAIEDPQVREYQEGFDEIVAADKLSYYPDYPVTGLLNFLQTHMSSMSNGNETYDVFLKELQEFYDAGRSEALDG